MTNFKQTVRNKKRGGNRKDGDGPGRRQSKAQHEACEAEWITAGFSRKWIRGAPRLTYTWPGNFPIFTLAPGMVTDDQGTHEGLVARYAPADREILFPYGTSPAQIRAQLNDEIFEIMQHDADVDAPLNWQPASEWIDIDVWMAA
jgi:hypothetical protein